MFGRKKNVARTRSLRAAQLQKNSRKRASASSSHHAANSALDKTSALISNSAASATRSLNNHVSAVVSQASSESLKISQTAVKKMSAARSAYTSVINAAQVSIGNSLATAKARLASDHKRALRNAYLNASSATQSAIGSALPDPSHHAVHEFRQRPLKTASESRHSARPSYEDTLAHRNTVSNYNHIYKRTASINHSFNQPETLRSLRYRRVSRNQK
mgnify:CR=1 FL=1